MLYMTSRFVQACMHCSSNVSATSTPRFSGKTYSNLNLEFVFPWKQLKFHPSVSCVLSNFLSLSLCASRSLQKAFSVSLRSLLAPFLLSFMHYPFASFDPWLPVLHVSLFVRFWWFKQRLVLPLGSRSASALHMETVESCHYAYLSSALHSSKAFSLQGKQILSVSHCYAKKDWKCTFTLFCNSPSIVAIHTYICRYIVLVYIDR